MISSASTTATTGIQARPTLRRSPRHHPPNTEPSRARWSYFLLTGIPHRADRHASLHHRYAGEDRRTRSPNRRHNASLHPKAHPRPQPGTGRAFHAVGARRRYHHGPVGKRLDDAIAVLNGAIGDYLVRRGNGLAIELALVCDGAPIPAERAALARAYPRASGKAVLLGTSCDTERAFDLEAAATSGLDRDLGLCRSNSATTAPPSPQRRRVATRSRACHPAVPLQELVLVGYSMGGLVTRSACHAGTLAGHRWLARVKRAVYVGTPHRGAPMERGGRVLSRVLAAIPDPYVRLVGEIAELRSDGLKDLGDAELRHEDRARRVRGWALTDAEHPVPLLPSIRHCLIAGAISADPWLAALFGDAVVPLASATHHGQGEVQLETTLLTAVTIGMDAPPEDRARPARLRSDARLPGGGLAHGGLRMSSDDKRLRGLVNLVVDAVEHGSRAVEKLHLGTTQRTFDILEALPVIETPARVAHTVHDLSVRGVYGAIRLVNRGVGAAIDLGIDVATQGTASEAGTPTPRDDGAAPAAPPADGDPPASR